MKPILCKLKAHINGYLFILHGPWHFGRAKIFADGCYSMGEILVYIVMLVKTYTSNSTCRFISGRNYHCVMCGWISNCGWLSNCHHHHCCLRCVSCFKIQWRDCHYNRCPTTAAARVANAGSWSVSCNITK